MFRSFLTLLDAKRVPGAVPILKPNGTLRDYGALRNDPIFKAAYPTLATHLSAVHTRRNRLPNAHPFEKNTGIKSTWLITHEQREMVAHLLSAYNEIINICRRLGFNKRISFNIVETSTQSPHLSPVRLRRASISSPQPSRNDTAGGGSARGTTGTRPPESRPGTVRVSIDGPRGVDGS